MIDRREQLAAGVSGLLLGAAFLPRVPGALAWVALVPMLWALERRVAHGSRRSLFTLGFAGGAVFFLIGTHWIALLSDVALTIGWLKYLGWILGALYLACYWGLATWAAGLLARRSGVPARWTFVVALLLVEELRGSGDLGFPWFQPGYTQSEILPVLQLAALGGVTLVTAWVLVVNAAFLSLAKGARDARARGAAALTVLLLFAVPFAWGSLELRKRTPPAGPVVALVQGNIPGEIKWSGKHQDQILSDFLRLTASGARFHPSLVIWPETATGTYLRRNPVQSIAVAQLAARMQTAIFMGFAHWTFGPDGQPQPWNAAGMWNPDGSLSPVYAKRHLVPFGERVPFQSLFPALGHWDLGQAEWRQGDRTELYRGVGPGAPPLGVLICFESIFPDLARRDVLAGAKGLINITNDEWFGNGAALVQHAAMAPFRAVEHRVPLYRCANTGITAVFDAYGVETARLPVFESRVLLARMPEARGTTLYTRFGDWPGALALALLLVLILAPWQWAWRASQVEDNALPSR